MVPVAWRNHPRRQPRRQKMISPWHNGDHSSGGKSIVVPSYPYWIYHQIEHLLSVVVNQLGVILGTHPKGHARYKADNMQ